MNTFLCRHRKKVWVGYISLFNLVVPVMNLLCTEAWLCDDNALCRDATPNSTTRLKDKSFKDVVRKSYISFSMKGLPYV